MIMAGEELGKITDEAAWKKIAQLHSSDAVLDERSISLIKHQNPNLTQRELAQLLQKFQDSIALDTVRNEYLMHTKLYTWIVKDPVRDDVEKLNEQVYARLFLTPNSDPWLGLFSTDVYTALDNGGVTKQ
jgi:CHAT domain-containing protein